MRSKTNFRVSFFLKKTKLLKSGEASVSMRITVDGQRVENNIRKSILPNLWDQSKERAKGTSKTAIDLNRFIEEARIKIHQIITEPKNMRQIKAVRGLPDENQWVTNRILLTATNPHGSMPTNTNRKKAGVFQMA